MAINFSQLLSPTMLLYSFIVFTQIGFGLYYGRQIEPPAAYTLLYAIAVIWIVGWWLRSDSRKRGIPLVYDMGFFLYVAWPFIMPYYLFKSRGVKGLIIILGFVCAYVGALLVGVTISVMIG
jgi:hypothetical protein